MPGEFTKTAAQMLPNPKPYIIGVAFLMGAALTLSIRPIASLTAKNNPPSSETEQPVQDLEVIALQDIASLARSSFRNGYIKGFVQAEYVSDLDGFGLFYTADSLEFDAYLAKQFDPAKFVKVQVNKHSK